MTLPTEWIWILAGLVVLAVIGQLLGKKGQKSQSLPSYQAAKALFTPAERSFFGVLKQTVGAEFEIFGKVRVADIISCLLYTSPSPRD